MQLKAEHIIRIYNTNERMEGRDKNGRFQKGHIETPEEKLKRIEANRLAWKNRPDYIGDLIQQCPRLHSVWRGIRFTQKAKRIGCSKEWEAFRTFYNDVFPTYRSGLHFRRPDVSKPYSKDNFLWVSSEDETSFKSRSIKLTYKGETLLLKDWADKLNLSLAGLRTRYHKYKNEYSVEEILFGRKKDRGSKEPKDIRDENVNIRAKASKMISSYRHKDKKNGVSICDMDINWMIQNILIQPCIYCGDTNRIGADRVDNSKGHIKENVVPCCYECNCAKNDNFSFDEMKIIGKTISLVKSRRENFKKKSINIMDALNPKKPSDFRWKRDIYQYDENNNIINKFTSIKEAALQTGLQEKGIGAACNGRDHQHMHEYRGFYWRFVERK